MRTMAHRGPQLDARRAESPSQAPPAALGDESSLAPTPSEGFGHRFGAYAVEAPQPTSQPAPAGANQPIQRVTEDQRRAFETLRRGRRNAQLHTPIHFRVRVQALLRELEGDTSDEAATLRQQLQAWSGASASSATPSRLAQSSATAAAAATPTAERPPSSRSSRAPARVSGEAALASSSTHPASRRSQAPVAREPSPAARPPSPARASTSAPSAEAPFSIPVRESRRQKMTGAPDPRWEHESEWSSNFDVNVDPQSQQVRAQIRLETAADPAAFDRWQQAVSDKWSERFQLAVPRPGERRSDRYPIHVDLARPSRGEAAHYPIIARSPSDPDFTASRGLRGTDSMTTWGTEDVVDVPHEVGHMLGNLDEYYTVNDVQHTGPGEAARRGVDVEEGSIMNDPKNNPHARHYELIRQKVEEHFGRGVEIEPMESRASRLSAPAASAAPSPLPGLGVGDVGAARSALRPVSRRPAETPAAASEPPTTDFRSLLRPATERAARASSSAAQEPPASGPEVGDFRSLLRSTGSRGTAEAGADRSSPSRRGVSPAASSRVSPTRSAPRVRSRPLPEPPGERAAAASTSTTPASSEASRAPVRVPRSGAETGMSSSAAAAVAATQPPSEAAAAERPTTADPTTMARNGLRRIRGFLAQQEAGERRAPFDRRMELFEGRVRAMREAGGGQLSDEQLQDILSSMRGFWQELQAAFPDE